jgi:hypothetical protein
MRSKLSRRWWLRLPVPTADSPLDGDEGLGSAAIPSVDTAEKGADDDELPLT